MVDLVKKGDIFYVDLNNEIDLERKEKIPVVIIQNDIANKYAPTVIVAAITSQFSNRKLPTHVEISFEEYGTRKDSIILLEQIRTLDKKKLKEKIGVVSDEIIEMIDNALAVSLNIEKCIVTDESEKLKKYILDITRPLVITEGKTDVKLIETAWEKLYPDKEMFFECMASGIHFDKEKRAGSADNVRRTIEYWSTRSERPIIGLFDNDKEGNNQFKGLNDDIFEKHDIKKSIRKHKCNNVWGMLLPVPSKRKIFVTDDDISQRYFVIEHYFSDNILKKHLMYGRNILGTCVFEVNNRKNKFSDEVNNLDIKEFEDFEILFSEIKNLFSF